MIRYTKMSWRVYVILAAEIPPPNFFLESTYENRGKQYPEYLMNRDGFSLLVMGFKAMNWKIKYIEAFNEMEQQLKEQRYDKKRTTNRV